MSRNRTAQQNPAKLIQTQIEKRSRTYEDEPKLKEHGFNFIAKLPVCVDIQRESHLEYIKYHGLARMEGAHSFFTKQEFDSLVDADMHLETQNSHDQNYLIRPYKCLDYNNKHMLNFTEVIRDFNDGWIHEHAAGEVSEAVMWKIMKKIVKNMRYLSTEAESRRPHGNLSSGVVITTKIETLFINLKLPSPDAKTYPKDIEDLHGFLEKILVTLKKNNSSIQGHVERWIKFLSESCLPGHVKEDFDPVVVSEIFPPFRSLDHVRLILNYPSSWEDDDVLKFLENMHKLCTETPDLLRNPAFESHLVEHYPQWNDCFISGRNTSYLNEVYKVGVRDGNYGDQLTGKLCVPTIVIFAYGCVKHHHDSANDYNIYNQSVIVTDPGHMDPYLTRREILVDLQTEFPYLIENIYEAYFKAVASGFKHPPVRGIENIENMLPRFRI